MSRWELIRIIWKWRRLALAVARPAFARFLCEIEMAVLQRELAEARAEVTIVKAMAK